MIIICLSWCYDLMVLASNSFDCLQNDKSSSELAGCTAWPYWWKTQTQVSFLCHSLYLPPKLSNQTVSLFFLLCYKLYIKALFTSVVVETSAKPPMCQSTNAVKWALRHSLTLTCVMWSGETEHFVYMLLKHEQGHFFLLIF